MFGLTFFSQAPFATLRTALVNKSLTADAGSYLLTGTDAALEVGFKVLAEAGSYELTGVDAGVIVPAVAFEIDAEAGSYLLTGTDAFVEAGLVVTNTVGAYLLRGQHQIVDHNQAIFFVGGKDDTFEGDTTTATISLTDLIGGLASAPAAGDLVVISYGVGSSAARNADLSITGYTEIADLFRADNAGANLGVFYKFMTDPPDTTFERSATGNVNDAGAITVHVLRGVDPTTPLDVAHATATAANSLAASPPAVTPITPGAWVYGVGAGALGTLATTYQTSDLADFHSVRSADTFDVALAAGLIAWDESGAVDPSAFTGLSSSNGSWAALTMALRPAAGAAEVDAEAGSYLLAGTDAALEWNRQLVVEAGSYALTGVDAAPEASRIILAVSGSYLITGVEATLEHGWRVSVQAGSYVLTGTDAFIEPGREVVAGAGSYLLTGTAALPERGWEVAVDPGSYLLSGTAASVERGREVAVPVAGSYLLSGTAAFVEPGREVAAAAGSYLLTGSDVSLERSYIITAEAGSYELIGTDAAITTFGETILVAELGSYELIGSDATEIVWSGPVEPPGGEGVGWIQWSRRRRRRQRF